MLKNSILKLDLDLHFKVKLRPKVSKIAKSLTIFFSRTISARGKQKTVSKSLRGLFASLRQFL
jgi:hypothetical protein